MQLRKGELPLAYFFGQYSLILYDLMRTLGYLCPTYCNGGEFDTALEMDSMKWCSVLTFIPTTWLSL